MNIKTEITKYVADKNGLPTDDKSIRELKRIWWCSTRNKPKGGLQLTNEGVDQLILADIKCHLIKIDRSLELTNQNIIWLDNFIDCPWHLTDKDIRMFTERMAIQLVLFSGNIQKYLFSRSESLKSH